MEAMNYHLVFVYGTLRRGQYRDITNLEGVTAVGDGTISGQIFSVAGGAFPGLALSDKGTVVGEVYQVIPEVLKRLDDIEGYREADPSSSFYLRKKVNVTMADGTAKETWAYEAGRMAKGVFGPLIEGGDWVAHVKARG